MPANITDVVAYTSPVVVPVDGELVSGADRLLTAQALANRTAYLQSLNLGAADRSFVTLPLSCCTPGVSGWEYYHTPAADLSLWVQSDVSGGFPLILDITPYIPVGVTVSQIRAIVSCAWPLATPHSALPNMPSLNFYEFDPSLPYGATYTATQVDTSLTVGAYNAIHVIQVAASKTIAALKRYTVVILGESGSNAVANSLGVVSLDLSFTAP